MSEKHFRYMAGGGLVLLTVGMLCMAARIADEKLTWGLIVTGGALLVLTAALNHRAVLMFSRRRSSRHGANAILLTIFFTAILVIVQAISVRNSWRGDFTRNQRHTLAPQTRSILNNLTSDVTVYVFFRSTSLEATRVREFLDRYAHENAHLRYEIIDPDQHPERARSLGTGNDLAVVSCGGRRSALPELNEERLTNAIVHVTRSAFKSIYFATGHAERSLSSHERDGYFHASGGLTNEGYNVQELSLTNTVRIPDDCEVLVVAGPRRAYLSSELELISAYLDRGGAALFLLDARLELPGIADLLATYNIEAMDAVLIDELGAADGDRVFDATVTKVQTYVRHPITDDFATTTMFPRARPIRITEDSSSYRVTADYLAITESSSWGELDMQAFTNGIASRDPSDLAGPLPVAAVVERKHPFDPSASKQPPSSRMVIVGDSDFASNAYYRVLGNSDFFHNVVNFLAEDEDLISIRPRGDLGDAVYISAGQGRLVFIIVIVLLPLSSALVGASVVWRRR